MLHKGVASILSDPCSKSGLTRKPQAKSKQHIRSSLRKILRVSICWSVIDTLHRQFDRMVLAGLRLHKSFCFFEGEGGGGG